MSAVVLAIAAGAASGLLFFGGLWWTVRRGLTAPAPALWFLLSALGRTAAVLVCFQLVAQGNVINLFGCLAGFVLARVAISHIVRLPSQGRQNAHRP